MPGFRVVVAAHHKEQPHAVSLVSRLDAHAGLHRVPAPNPCPTAPLIGKVSEELPELVALIRQHCDVTSQARCANLELQRVQTNAVTPLE